MSMENDVVVTIEALAAGDSIRIAVLPGEVEALGFDSYSPEQLEQWSAVARENLSSSEESRLLSTFSRFREFALVDRRIIETIIEEQEMGLTGAVAEPVEVGRLTGATHVLDVSIVRTRDESREKGYRDLLTRRLISVESGELLATVIISFN